MGTLMITEQKKTLTDVILVVIFGVIPLHFLVSWLLEARRGRFSLFF